MNNLIVDIIRHGEPEGGSRYRGYGIDDPLSAKGWEQMWAATGEAMPWQHVFTSPLLRCRAFAEALAGKRNRPVTIVENLKEVGFGNWEGKTKAQLREIDAEGFRGFYQDPVRNRPEGAEKLQDFIRRVQAAYDTIIKQEACGHILIVAHAGVIRAILAGVINLEPEMMYRIMIKNAGIMRINYDGPTGYLEWLNGRMGVMA
jgi:probable phosphoglycerate mutase